VSNNSSPKKSKYFISKQFVLVCPNEVAVKKSNDSSMECCLIKFLLTIGLGDVGGFENRPAGTAAA